MKEELKPYISGWETLQEAKNTIDDWMDYYNNERYQWDLAKLSHSQFYNYYTTGESDIQSLVGSLFSRVC